MICVFVVVLFSVLSMSIGQVEANAACQVPFQQHPTRPDLCYTRLPKRKCDWIPGSRFIQGNCFVPSGHDVVPSRKFFCDFNEYFQHCKNVPGYCCMQSTKFDCDKYTVVEYNATLGTCFAPVGQISIRTADNVDCPKPFEYDESCRQCVADVENPKSTLDPDECKALGGEIIGNKCFVDPPPPPPPPPPPCTDITDPDCLPPPFTSTTLLPTTTFETTEPTTTDEPKTTTVTDFTTPKPTTSEPTEATTDLTTTTPQPSTPGTGNTTYDPTKTTDSSTVTTTTVTPPTTETTDVTNSGTVTTTTPGLSTTPNSTSDGTTTTSTPPSTGFTSTTTEQPPTSTDPITPDYTTAPTPTPSPNNRSSNDFNVSHNCPVGFLTMPHSCVGVWTPDCETKYNGYKHVEACYINFNGSSSNSGNCGGGESLLPSSTTLTTTTTTTPVPTTTTPKPTTRTTKNPDPWPNCVDFAINCQQNKHLCTNSIYQHLMISKCARTCGYCHCGYNAGICGVTPRPTSTPAPQCTDVGHDCAAKKAWCNNNLYGQLMVEKCKLTCGYCTCTNSMNCDQLVRTGQCNNTARRLYMARNCRQACGWC